MSWSAAPWSEDEFVAALREQGSALPRPAPVPRADERRRAVPRGAPALGREPLLLPALDPDQGRGDPLQLPRAGDPPRVDLSASSTTTGSRASLGRDRVLAAPRRVARRRPRRRSASERLVLPGVRYSVDAYVNFCRQEPWVFAVASSLTELFGPGAIKVRLAALEEHYPWIDPAGLEYFRARLTLAPRDAQYALGVTAGALPHPRRPGARGRRALLQDRPALGAARRDRPRRHASRGRASREPDRDALRPVRSSPPASASTTTRCASRTCCSSPRGRWC